MGRAEPRRALRISADSSLCVGNSLAANSSTKSEAGVIDELIDSLDEKYGFFGTLDNSLWDLHTNGYGHEPKPRVVRAFKLALGDKTENVLSLLRRAGYRTESKTVTVEYEPDSDPYVGVEAADLKDLSAREK